MKEAICPLCGSNKSERRFSEREYDVFVCQTCELFFIHPYGKDVHEKVSTYDYDNLKIIDSDRHYVSSKRYYTSKYFSYIASECKDAKSLLDVGCGTGALLELLNNINPDMRRIGIELNAERAKFAKRVAKCEIYQVPIEKFSYESKFDVITIINVLSHIPSFDDLFTSIHKLIAKNGKIILKVGEMAIDVKKDAVFDWGIPDHLHFLGTNTLQFICNKYDFKIIRHDQQMLSNDLFSRRRWNTQGRNSFRNLLKRLVVLTPFALSAIRKIHEIRHGNKIFSSFVVISPK